VSGAWLREGALSLAVGIALGLAYFAGLWWTSRRVTGMGQPGLLLLGSFAVRAALLLGGWWLATGGHPVGTALFMAGFLISRRFMLAWAASPSGPGAGAPGGKTAAGARPGGDGEGR